MMEWYWMLLIAWIVVFFVMMIGGLWGVSGKNSFGQPMNRGK